MTTRWRQRFYLKEDGWSSPDKTDTQQKIEVEVTEDLLIGVLLTFSEADGWSAGPDNVSYKANVSHCSQDIDKVKEALAKYPLPKEFEEYKLTLDNILPKETGK